MFSEWSTCSVIAVICSATKLLGRREKARNFAKSMKNERRRRRRITTPACRKKGQSNRGGNC